MPTNEINELILNVVEQSTEDKNVRDLIKQALQYELDIWNRHIVQMTIKDEYDQMVEKILKR